jgi:FixJ family two-component response regulator
VTDATLCIAVVDDEVAVRTALGRLLRLADYEVMAFASGEAFLAWATAHRPACVILDVHMPGLSGLGVRSQFLAAHPDLPTIFITASDDDALDRAVLQVGGMTLLRKPFSNESLLDAVDAAIRAGQRGAR